MRYTLYIICSLLAITADARERSLEEMQRIADSYLDAAPLPKGGSPSGWNAPFRAGLPSVLHCQQGFTVLGYPSGGFAIVANDDDVEAVLGYSTTAAYDSICVPDGLKWWMESVERALASKPRYTRSSTGQYNKTGVESVEPLVSSHWGQDKPYNWQCPKALYSKGNMVTGCIATAMAQVMRYHEWPEVGDGDVVYNFAGHVYADFAATQYDWGNMLYDYQRGSYSDAEGDAVAQLMLHCGVSVNMKYDDSASGAQAQFIPGAMRDHFRYNKNVNYRNRMLHTDAEWMGSIYEELAAGRPIIYNGQDTRMSYGHSFIFDGYNAEGLVHVNWGWDGNCDGYFDINLLNSGYMGMEFPDAQAMIVGIAKPDVDIKPSLEVGIINDLDLYATGNARIYQLDATNLQVYCLNDYDLAGTLAMIMPTPSGIRTLAVIESFTKDDPLQSFTYLTPMYETYNIAIPFGLSNGKYNFFLAFKEEGHDEWHPLYSAEGKLGYFVLDKQGSDYQIVGVTDNIVSIDAVAIDETTPTNSSAYNLSGQKVDDSYRGIVITEGKKVIIK